MRVRPGPPAREHRASRQFDESALQLEAIACGIDPCTPACFHLFSSGKRIEAKIQSEHGRLNSRGI